MKATCGKCGVKADVKITAPGRMSYSIEHGGSLQCPVVQERMEKNGGSTSDTDCDFMLQAVQWARQKRGL